MIFDTDGGHSEFHNNEKLNGVVGMVVEASLSRRWGEALYDKESHL